MEPHPAFARLTSSTKITMRTGHPGRSSFRTRATPITLYSRRSRGCGVQTSPTGSCPRHRMKFFSRRKAFEDQGNGYIRPAHAASSHGVRFEQPLEHAQVLRRPHRPAADGDAAVSRTCCSAKSAPTPICFFGLADGSALAFFQFVRPSDPEALRAEDAGYVSPSRRAERHQGNAGRHREAPAQPRATPSRRSTSLSTATANRCMSRIRTA